MENEQKIPQQLEAHFMVFRGHTNVIKQFTLLKYHVKSNLQLTYAVNPLTIILKRTYHFHLLSVISVK